MTGSAPYTTKTCAAKPQLYNVTMRFIQDFTHTTTQAKLVRLSRQKSCLVWNRHVIAYFLLLAVKKKIYGLGRKKKKNKKSYCHMPYLSFIITNKPTNCVVSFYHKWHAKTYLNQHPPSSTRCYLTKSRTTTPVQRSQNLKTWLGPPTG